jgi:hypothetical protein
MVFEGTVRYLYNFCNWANMTPDFLIAKCKNPDDSPNLSGITEIERLIDDYARALIYDV